MNDKSFAREETANSKKKFEVEVPFYLRPNERIMALNFLEEDLKKYGLKFSKNNFNDSTPTIIGSCETVEKFVNENSIMFGLYLKDENGKEYRGKPFKV